MPNLGAVVLTLAVGMAHIACGGSSPTGPSSNAGSGYTGRWAGSTSQGTEIGFTVSSDRKITEITVSYRFGGCSGTRTFSGLTIEIGPFTPPPGTPLLPSGVVFSYTSSRFDEPDFMQVTGEFTSSATASGVVVFVEFPGCGTGTAIWTATKR